MNRLHRRNKFCRNKGCRRWAQNRYGYCRTCANKKGLDVRSMREREAERAAAQRAFESLIPPAPEARGKRTVVIQGREYEVVWDGSLR